MASHKTELRINVVEDFDWPALQEYSILTPRSLCPRDVTVDGDEHSVLRLTPNSISGKFSWADRSRTPSTSHTFGFPLSPVSVVSKFSPEAQSPLEKHKRRLRRYNNAESVLARLPAAPILSPSQLRANAVQYAASSVATHIRDARQSLRAVRNSGRRDSTRWMAEHRLAALESLQAELATSSASGAGCREDDARRKREANLVRFLGVHRGEGLVPVFTRTRGGRRPPAPTSGETERRHMTVGSPMQLQSEVMRAQQTTRSEWPWETRVRSVLLNPTPKPPPATPLSMHTPTSSLALSTPTSGTFSSLGEPDTPLTEVEEEDEEDEDEDEDEYEDYPTFRIDSALSDDPPNWRPRRTTPLPRLQSKPQGPVPMPSLPPLATNLKPDASYAWLADSSTWVTPSAWHGDGWEVPASSTASPISARSSTSSFPSSPALAPRTPTRPQTLPPAPVHRFWSRNSGGGERHSGQGHRRLPSLRPISEGARDAALYAVKPLPPPPTPSSVPHTPRTPQTPHTPHTPSLKKGRHFFSGLVRRKPSEHDLALAVEVERERQQAEREREHERERNVLRKRGSMRSLLSTRSSTRSSTYSQTQVSFLDDGY